MYATMGASAVPGMAFLCKQKRLANISSRNRLPNDASSESYKLLLELSSQEPTLQSCFKVIESTCLAKGIQLRIRGRAASEQFQKFLDRYYLPFAEHAIRHFFTLGFVPWRLRRLASGDCVPEAIPLGMFTWSIDSIPNRTTAAAAAEGGRERRKRPRQLHSQAAAAAATEGVEQVAARRAFENQKQYFASDKKPYPLDTDDAAKLPVRKTNHGMQTNTPAYYRQQDALRRQQKQYPRADDEDTKMLRC